MPAVRGGWRKGMAASSREYLPLTSEIVASHLTGHTDLGLYPLLDGDRCWWMAADFDGSAAMLDALSYLKAARAVGAPVALEVSRSGLGAHAWLFFTSPVPAATARQVGTGELHGLASGARVVPRPAPRVPPRFGHENHPWRRSEDRGLHLPMGQGLLGQGVDRSLDGAAVDGDRHGLPGHEHPGTPR